MSSGLLNQVRVAWTGFLGGPGVSTFYYPTTSDPPLPALRTFLNALVGFLPNKVTMQVANSGQTIDSTSGQLVGSWGGLALPASVTGGGTTNIMSAEGFQVVWGTNEFSGGHAIKGRTLFVPAMAAIMDGDGLLTVGTVATIKAAATACAGSSPQLAVWHRPKKGPKPSGGGPAPIIRPGAYALVTTADCPRKAVVLTSRRD